MAAEESDYSSFYFEKPAPLITRALTHSGVQYNKNAKVLQQQISTWMKKVPAPQAPAKAIIAPHPNYDTGGLCMAHAWKQVRSEKVKRVFLLGPSHTTPLTLCALSGCQVYKTPFSDMLVDQHTNQELMGSGLFQVATKQHEEKEHSIELQLPFLCYIMGIPLKKVFTIVPILVGSSAPERCGPVFAPYFLDPENLFVFSGDLTHWGKRYGYIDYNRRLGPIYNSIQATDDQVMRIIESLNLSQFVQYITTSGNYSICGSNVFRIFLATVDHLLATRKADRRHMKMSFLNYHRSSLVKSTNEHSISHAAGAFVLKSEKKK